MNPEEFMKKMMKMSHGKLVKTIQPTDAEANEWMQLQAFKMNAEKSMGMFESRRKLFWAQIELRTGEVTRHLHFNDKKQTIEVYDSGKAMEDMMDGEDGDGFEN
jgi:hypothetical protein